MNKKQQQLYCQLSKGSLSHATDEALLLLSPRWSEGVFKVHPSLYKIGRRMWHKESLYVVDVERCRTSPYKVTTPFFLIESCDWSMELSSLHHVASHISE